jgi:hypothetical protein
MSDDPTCNICSEPKSAHVATEKGDFTHPREARGEGHYEQASPGYIRGGGPWLDDEEVGPSYRFVPSDIVRPAPVTVTQTEVTKGTTMTQEQLAAQAKLVADTLVAEFAARKLDPLDAASIQTRVADLLAYPPTPPIPTELDADGKPI